MNFIKAIIKDKIKFRIEPYIVELNEAKRVVILLFGAIIFLFIMDIDLVGMIWVISILLICTIPAVARIPILSFFDKIKKKTITKKLKFEYATTEYTSLGDLHGNSKIGKYYDSPLEVDRYKLIFRNENNHKVKIRNITSRRRINRLYSLEDDFSVGYVNVTYLALSRILIWIDVDIDSLNIKDKKKHMELEKTILNINNQL